MTTTKTEIHPGDRYIDRDWRNPGRVVEVRKPSGGACSSPRTRSGRSTGWR